MKNTRKFLALIAAAGSLAAPSALALDGKVALDQLVKKGILSPEEADAIIKKDNEKQQSKPVLLEAKQTEARKVVISGRVQAQGKYLVRDNKTSAGNNDAGQTATAGFELRRVNLAADVEISQGFSGFLDIETTLGNGGANPTFIIDKAGVKLDTDAGSFAAASQKTRFGLEEYTSASNLYTIERSAVSNYFAGSSNGTTNLGLGGRHIGLYWETADLKKIEKDGGLRVGAAVANSTQIGSGNGASTPQNESYAPVVYLNADYGVKIDDATMLTFGGNLAYTEANINQLAAGNGTTTGLGGNTNTNRNFDTRTIGLEFISKLKSGNLTLIGDFMTARVENGKFATAPGATANTGNAVGVMPWGVTGTVAYKVTEQIEPLIQLGYVDSQGRGIGDGTFRDFPNNGSSASPTAVTGSTTYDKATTLFIGSAYYITPKTIKLTAGLDCARFEGQANGTVRADQKTDVIGGRVQLQLLF